MEIGIDMKEQKKKEISLKENTFFNMLKTVCTIMLPLITFPYSSRILHAQNIGKINFGTSIVNYFTLIAALGITTYAVRECSRVKNNTEQFSQTVNEIFSINIVSTIISYFILIGCLIFVPDLKGYTILILIQSIPIIFTTLGADWINTTMEDFKYIAIRTLIVQLFILLAMFIFVKEEKDYYNYAVIFMLSTSAANIVNIIYRRKFCKTKFILKMNIKKHSIPIMMLFATTLSQTILPSIDMTMLGIAQGDVSVGLYSTAAKIINCVSQVVISIAWVVMPKLSYDFANKNYNRINNMLYKVSLLTVTVGMPCVVGINVIAPELIEIFGGHEYVGASSCMQIMTITMAIGFIVNILGNMILIPLMKEKQFMIACVVSVGVNIILNGIMIPLWNMNGAAVATVMSSLVMILIATLKFDKNIHIKNLKKVFTEVFVGCLCIVISAWIIKMFLNGIWVTTIAVIFVSVVIYAAVLLLFKNEVALQIINILKKLLFAITKKNCH